MVLLGVVVIIRISLMVGMDWERGDSVPQRGDGLWHDRLTGLQQLPYLTFLVAMMKKQPMMASAMDVGNAKL